MISYAGIISSRIELTPENDPVYGRLWPDCQESRLALLKLPNTIRPRYIADVARAEQKINTPTRDIKARGNDLIAELKTASPSYVWAAPSRKRCGPATAGIALTWCNTPHQTRGRTATTSDLPHRKSQCRSRLHRIPAGDAGDIVRRRRT